MTQNRGNMWVVIVIVIAIIAGGVYYFSTREAAAPTIEETATTTPTGTATTTDMTAGMTQVSAGTYVVATSSSTFNWVGKKPLIAGYLDSGTIQLKDGVITVGTSTASGSFTVDMKTIQVGKTTREGQESELEKVLKGNNFFQVTTYPTTMFKITSVTARGDSATSFTYDVKGTLTMKAKTNEITFPAKIYMKDGMLRADASVDVDRTKWGITYNSGSFFDNLANNVISDTFTLSFNLVAVKK